MISPEPHPGNHQQNCKHERQTRNNRFRRIAHSIIERSSFTESIAACYIPLPVIDPDSDYEEGFRDEEMRECCDNEERDAVSLGQLQPVCASLLACGIAHSEGAAAEGKA